MPTKTIVVSSDQRPEIERLIHSLPAMLAGVVPDERGIAAGFRARIGWAFFSLVAPNFNDLGRGRQGADGDKWPLLSAAYLAYQRPVTGRQPPRGGKLAPGGKDGLLTEKQLKLWRRTFADCYAWYVMREPDDEAKAHAAAIAWIVVKQAGGKTKLEKFGQRQVGVDYQILVDTGRLRQSLQAGELMERGSADAEYRIAEEQYFDDQRVRLVVGTNVAYAGYHHNAKNPNRRRRLWPERFPSDWWNQILGVARSGLIRIGELFGGTAA